MTLVMPDYNLLVGIYYCTTIYVYLLLLHVSVWLTLIDLGSSILGYLGTNHVYERALFIYYATIKITPYFRTCKQLHGWFTTTS